MTSTAQPHPPQRPALWHEPPPRHFDSRVPCWLKSAAMLAATLIAIFFLDQRIAVWADVHRIPDLMRLRPDGSSYGDSGRELMFLEQYGQGVCTIIERLSP